MTEKEKRLLAEALCDWRLICDTRYHITLKYPGQYSRMARAHYDLVHCKYDTTKDWSN